MIRQASSGLPAVGVSVRAAAQGHLASVGNANSAATFKVLDESFAVANGNISVMARNLRSYPMLDHLSLPTPAR